MGMGLWAVVLLTLAGGPAQAGDPATEVSSIQERYEAGKAALRERRFDDALRAFRGALDLDADGEVRWQLELAVALTHTLSGAAIEALEYHWRFLVGSAGRVAERDTKWLRRRADSSREVEELEAAVLRTRGLVTVATEPPGARLRVNGRRVGHEGSARTPFRLYLLPGTYALQVDSRGHSTYSATVRAVAGERHKLVAHLVPEPVAKAPLPTPSVQPAIAAHRDESPAWWIVGSIGVTSVVVGGIMHGLSRGDLPELRRISAAPATAASAARYRELRGRAEDRETAAYALYVGGGLALAAGAVLLVLGDDAAEPGAPGAVVARF